MKCWREPEELPVHKRNSGNGDRYQYMCGGGKRDKFCIMLSWASLVALLLLLSRFSHVRLCATPETTAHQASLSLGFSRQEHWSGLPFPSPMHESEK